MSRIYLDNAATSFPKPREVADAVYEYMTSAGSSVNRGCYSTAYRMEEMLFETRMLLCDLFGGDPANVVFTKNVTESLNVILKGFLRPGDHVLVSSMEHNAVMRPLRQLEKAGVSFTRIPCDSYGRMVSETLAADVEPLLQTNTRAVIMTHASNVCGTVLPAEAMGRFCAEHGLFFVLDTAQTAGILDIDIEKMHIDALAFTGHKGLLGPQGIGGFIVKKNLASHMEPLLSGGTGSVSHTEDLPSSMPDRFEPGTPNLPGIVGLNAALKWINEQRIPNLLRHELMLTDRFLEAIQTLEDDGLVRILGLHGLRDSHGLSDLHDLSDSHGLRDSHDLSDSHGFRDSHDLSDLHDKPGITTSHDSMADGQAIADAGHTGTALMHPGYGSARIGIVSVQTPGHEMSEVSHLLDSRYGIQTRVGLHCSPSAHRTLGTFPDGAIRFSFGWANSVADCNAAADALAEILREH